MQSKRVVHIRVVCSTKYVLLLFFVLFCFCCFVCVFCFDFFAVFFVDFIFIYFLFLGGISKCNVRGFFALFKCYSHLSFPR